MSMSQNLNYFNAELIVESSRRQRLSLLTSMLTISLRQYLRTHNNEIPPIVELPRAGMTLRNAFITDCTVLINADGTPNERPFADIVCLHTAGEEQRAVVIAGFVNIRPTAAPALGEIDDSSDTDMDADVDENVDWSAQLEAVVTTQKKKKTREKKQVQTVQDQQPGRARGRPAKPQDLAQTKAKRTLKIRPSIVATIAGGVVADTADTHQELPDRYSGGAKIEDDIVDDTIMDRDC